MSAPDSWEDGEEVVLETMWLEDGTIVFVVPRIDTAPAEIDLSTFQVDYQ